MTKKTVIVNGALHEVEVGYENWVPFFFIGDTKIVGKAPGYFDYTKEGLSYEGYIDTCQPYDKKGNKISVGDRLYASIKGEVEEVVVEKIADKPYHLGYGCHARKLKVRSICGDKVWTLPEGERTIKA